MISDSVCVRVSEGEECVFRSMLTNKNTNYDRFPISVLKPRTVGVMKVLPAILFLMIKGFNQGKDRYQSLVPACQILPQGH